jgi:hypothetical protein
MRLVHPHCLDRQNRVEQSVEPGGFDGRFEHSGSAIGEYRGSQARGTQLRKDPGDFGKGLQRQIEFHQLRAERRTFETQGLQ